MHYISMRYQQLCQLKKVIALTSRHQCAFHLQRQHGVCLYCKHIRLCSNSSVNEYLSSHGHDSQGDLALFPNPSVDNMFVPKCKPVSVEDIKRFQDFVNRSRKLLVLTGAGLSTESGIPDYRSEGVGLYARSTNRPVQYQDFVKYPEIRQRYWARNYVGWPKFGFFLPNSSHLALAEWEKLGKVHWLVTQNVDALHYKAGSKNVTELHGSAHRYIQGTGLLLLPKNNKNQLP